MSVSSFDPDDDDQPQRRSRPEASYDDVLSRPPRRSFASYENRTNDPVRDELDLLLTFLPDPVASAWRQATGLRFKTVSGQTFIEGTIPRSGRSLLCPAVWKEWHERQKHPPEPVTPNRGSRPPG